ncbi:MAG: hypothetical protein JRN25_04330 [Nitrososphaerota archaeon]|nr:hypothetical protein [Nitrososphaerota archaeon]
MGYLSTTWLTTTVVPPALTASSPAVEVRKVRDSAALWASTPWACSSAWDAWDCRDEA